MVTLTDTLSDRFSTSPVLTPTRVVSQTSNENVRTVDAVVPRWGMILSELLGISEATTVGMRFRPLILEAIYLQDRLVRGTPAAVSDQINISRSLTVRTAVVLIERLGLADTLLAAAKYRQTVAETLRLADTLARFVNGSLADGLGIMDALLGRALARGVLAEAIGIVETVTPRLLLSVVAPEGVRITEAQALKMLFRPTLAEGIEIGALYLSPGGGLTTWAMNTRTGGVTEYKNFPFNSFANYGEHSYLAAADDGLYELQGDDDNGADIIAQIKGGFLQFGGGHLSRLKAAYIAQRGSGDWVLKITTGEGLTYIYGVTAAGMHTAKVNMGKGQRARYFSYELISTGQDFDLDTLEFVPIVLERRV